MSSDSATLDPATEANRLAGLPRGNVPIDNGQPVDDLPPMIEPVAWETADPVAQPAAGLRPARRKFLAGASPAAVQGTPATDVVPPPEPMVAEELPFEIPRG